jgi:hypothetical protein
MNERKVLEVTYTSLDTGYINPSLRYIRGFQDADSSANPVTVGTLDDPRNSGIPMRPNTRDPKIFSFAYRGDVFFLLCRVVTTTVGDPSDEGRWSLIMAPTPPLGAWALMARDILLKDSNGNSVLANPYGLVQIGNTLHIVEYDTQKIYSLGANQLNGLPDNDEFTLDQDCVDLSDDLNEPDAKAQAIIAMTPATGNPIVAVLFTVSVVTNPATQAVIQKSGILARLNVSAAGVLSYDTQVFVGMNPQELVPVAKSNGDAYLLIPAIGGMQKDGSSNGTYSNISCVPAFGAWTYPLNTAPVLLKGDASGTYDFHDLGASYRADSDGFVYILTLIYAEDYAGTNWQLYRIKVGDLLGLNDQSIGQAISAEKLSLIDSGAGATGYFWQLLYETGSSAVKDRLYFFRGSALLVCPAKAYPASPVNPNPADGSYRYFNTGEADGDIGGYNVDWADLSVETVNQIAAGHSLKRSVQASIPPGAASEED